MTAVMRRRLLTTGRGSRLRHTVSESAVPATGSARPPRPGTVRICTGGMRAACPGPAAPPHRPAPDWRSAPHSCRLALRARCHHL